MTTKLNWAALLAAAAVMASPALAAEKTPGPLFAQGWIDGTNVAEPQMQVQRYDRDTYVIRQSVHTNFEAPFLYLLFGRDRALLLDTGAGGLAIRPTIDGLINQWLAEHHRTSIPLVVAHSHAHGDHRMGDPEFKDRPSTTVVGWTAEEVAGFFGIAHWPQDVARFDLGGRVLDIIPTPGHQPAHIMIFDERTRVLLSGDALYPGRLYVPLDEFQIERESIDRVVAFTKPRRVSHVLGAHIEMNRTPGQDYPKAAATHPDEHRLELPYSSLLNLQTALHAMGDPPMRQAHDDFIIFPVPPRPK